jgi:hypothetical protein
MLTLLCVFCAIFALQLHGDIGDPGGVPALAALIAAYLVPASVALWVRADAHARGRQPPHDFDSLVFFTWSVTAPIYLFVTRGWRALGIIVLFLLVYFGASLAAIFLDGSLSHPR